MSAIEKLTREWQRERDPGVWRVLRDALIEHMPDGIENPEAWVEEQLEEIKLEADQDIRRDHMEWVARENGNLNTTPWLVHFLSAEPPYEQKVRVPLAEGEKETDSRWASVTFRRGVVHHIIGRTDGDWVYFNYLDEPRAQALAQRAREKVLFIGLNGEEFWLEEKDIIGKTYKPSRLWLTMDGAPEHMQSDVEERAEERGIESPTFVTVYTDGGGYQTALDPALIDAKSGDLYQLVADGAHGAETECPLKDWDDENREEGRDRIVTVHDTYYGEEPNKACRYCGKDIGEEHGFLYVGEGQEAVYMMVEKPPLPSTVDSPEIEREIRDEFETMIAGPNDQVDVFYEHGHWWVRRTEVDHSDPSGRNDLENTYSVVDTGTGFDFEEV